MPKVAAPSKIIECPGEYLEGTNLRQVLLQQGIEFHSGRSTWMNCHGIDTGGTCVQIERTGSEPTWRGTSRRLLRKVNGFASLFPHSLMQNRRLACQTQVLEDVKGVKLNGFWGHDNEPLWNAEGERRQRE